jgi:hypothetical protein
MGGTAVRIADVAIEPSRVRHANHERYRITLECGCSWWQDSLQPPTIGTIASCFAPHRGRRVAAVPRRVPVATDRR